MIKPIPKRLLPHNCIYKKYLENLGEGDIWDNEFFLKHVKIEKKLQLKVTSNGREVVGNARMFYDCINSEGLKEEPKQDDIIIFNNKEYKVFDTEILYADSDMPHHYEVLLK